MLTPSQFQLWCRRLCLPPATCEILTRVRSSPPARRVQGRATNVCGAYASRKMGCTIQFESHTVELWAIYTMEHDPAVLEYYDQPTILRLRYPSKSGRHLAVSHTPDFSHSTQFSGNASIPSPSPCHWAGIPPCWVISNTDPLT